jgi:hypothetical protein
MHRLIPIKIAEKIVVPLKPEEIPSNALFLR